ncbi:MAG: hypothetical protein ACYC5H_17450 [Methylovirgula sp.]
MPSSNGTSARIDRETGSVATYEIVQTSDGWLILHNGRAEGALDTKMAAFDAIVEAAMTDILSGHGVVIKVEGNVSAVARFATDRRS